jgi:hypothetical protein
MVHKAFSYERSEKVKFNGYFIYVSFLISKACLLLTSIYRAYKLNVHMSRMSLIYRKHNLCVLFPSLTAPTGPGPPHFRGYMNAFRHTILGRNPLDKWSALFVPNKTQHLHHTDFCTTSGTRTRNPSKRVTPDPRLKQRGHKYRHVWSYIQRYCGSNWHSVTRHDRNLNWDLHVICCGFENRPVLKWTILLPFQL